MDDNEADEIHPLDRDYSISDASPQRKVRDKSTRGRIRRGATILFASGFIALLPAAIVTNSFPRSWLESAGSLVHRMAMWAILIGGLLIVASYRVPDPNQLAKPKRRSHRRPRRDGKVSYAMLLGWNVVILVGMALVFFMASNLGSPEFLYLLAIVLLMTTGSLMVTMLVWHRGFLRAYAIGVLASAVMVCMTTPFVPYWTWRLDEEVVLLAYFVIIIGNGLLCSGYVFLLEQFRDSVPEEPE